MARSVTPVKSTIVRNKVLKKSFEYIEIVTTERVNRAFSITAASFRYNSSLNVSQKDILCFAAGIFLGLVFNIAWVSYTEKGTNLFGQHFALPPPLCYVRLSHASFVPSGIPESDWNTFGLSNLTKKVRALRMDLHIPSKQALIGPTTVSEWLASDTKYVKVPWDDEARHVVYDEPNSHTGQMKTVSLPLWCVLALENEYNLKINTLQEIHVQYTINGKALQETCPMHGHLVTNLNLTRNEMCDTATCVTRLRMTATTLACERVYGLHRVSVYIQNNSTCNSAELSVMKFVVIPEATESVNNTALYRRLLNVDSTAGEIEPHVVRLLQRDATQIYSETSQSENHSQMLIFALFNIYIFSIAFFTAWFVLLTCSAFKSHRKAPFYRRKRTSIRSVTCYTSTEIDTEPDEDCYYTYDIFLCSSDAQYGIVTTRLLPMLEELGFRVCFPDRDFHQGKTNLELYSEAVKRSKKIVLVLDQDSKNKNESDSEFWQLPYILFPLVFGADRIQKKAVVVVYIRVQIASAVNTRRRLRFQFHPKVVEWKTEGADTELRQLLFESLA